MIWAKRYKLWNHIIPERFGNINHNKTTFGQSSIDLIGEIFRWEFLMKTCGGDLQLETVL